MSAEPFDPTALRARRRRFWLMFCERNGVAEGVPLFQVADGVVQTLRVGPKNRQALARHGDMEALVLAEAAKVTASVAAEDGVHDGLITVVYHEGGDGPEPIYIGTVPARDADGKLTRQLRNINPGLTHPFARWGYSKSCYLGALSHAVLGAQRLEPRRSKYGAWAQALFEEPLKARRLRREVRFWTRAWEPALRGPWLDFGPTFLPSLHAQLVAVASDGYPERLLTGVEGVFA